ncbi:MAG: hypothetical protein FWF37_01835 [Chloroflexi bacterium]|nr:hypothetical protein [Chloroflexota bacterium]
MKKSFTITVVVPIIWGILVTGFAVGCIFSFIINAKEDSPQILWAICILLGWLIAGLVPLLIGFASWHTLNQEKKEKALSADDGVTQK